MELLIRRQSAALPRLDVPQVLTAPMRTLLRHEGTEDAVEVSIVLCDDAFICALNAAHRGLDTATDVLSFAQDDAYLLGDIVISLETAQRQATAAGWPPDSEVALLAVHGLLHLLGYDDETAAGAALMRDKSVRALAETGIMLPEESRHPFFARFEDDP